MAFMDLFTIVGVISAVVLVAVIITLCNSSEGCNSKPTC